MKNFLKKNWNYIIAFFVPWVLIVIHSLIRESWLTGQGSILGGDAGTISYQMYMELWNKVHGGDSLIYSWNAGGGMDFLVGFFQYLCSPFTLLILLVPQKWVADMLQLVMVLKWSFASVTMLHYFMHTKHNTISARKKIVSLVAALCFSLGNSAIMLISNTNYYDALILFPLLLLLLEYMEQGKGYKRFYICLTLMLVCSMRIAVPISIFLIFWYFMQYEKPFAWKGFCRFLYMYVAAYLTSMVVMLPAVSMTVNNKKLYDGHTMGGFVKQIWFSFVEMIQRFYTCDTLRNSDRSEAMLYISIMALSMAMLFVFVPMQKRKKIMSVVLGLLLTTGLYFGAVSAFWHGFAVLDVQRENISFLLSFVLIYMALTTIGQLKEIKIWHVALCLFVGIGLFVYTFFHIEVYLDFYVYLTSILVFVLVLMLTIFFCKKSIQYQNMLVVLSVIGMLELFGNAYFQLEQYNMYPIGDIYYTKEENALLNAVKQKEGGNVAAVQNLQNNGFVFGVPAVSGELDYSNNDMHIFYEKLGMSTNKTAYEYFGGSPLLNVMLNVRYGLSTDAVSFSDASEKGSNGDYKLYEMQRLAGMGYMVSEDVTQWNMEQKNVFDVQNDFVKKAGFDKELFHVLTPEMTASSLLGGERLEHALEHADCEDESHDHDEDISPETVLEYDKDKQYYRYYFEKMYSEDIASTSFESDGVSDYYVFVKSDEDACFSVDIGEEQIYCDLIESKQKIFHIGVVEKGTKITIGTNAVVDDLGFDTVYYQVAAFDNNVFNEIFDRLSQSRFEISDMTSGNIKGSIEVKEDGIMMTSIPAQKGWKVYVDDKETDYHTIGDALIGVSLEKGLHTIRFEYSTPNLKAGLILSVVGILMLAVYVGIDSNKKRTKE